MRALVLFDIDGTLLTSAAAGREAIRTAFGETFGTLDVFDAVRFDGKTDPQIVRELCEAAPLRLQHGAAELREPVVAAARVLARRGPSLVDDPVVTEALDRRVQRARFERQATPGPVFHVLDDPVAVTRPTGQGEQDVIDDVRQGQVPLGGAEQRGSIHGSGLPKVGPIQGDAL